MADALTTAERAELVAYLPAEFQSSARIDVWIKGAQFRASRSYFGKSYVYALSLLVAHKAAMEARGADGTAGAVTSKKEGDLSVSYASGSSEGGDLSATSYGQEFLELSKTYSARPGITGRVIIGGLCGGNPLQSAF